MKTSEKQIKKIEVCFARKGAALCHNEWCHNSTSYFPESELSTAIIFTAQWKYLHNNELFILLERWATALYIFYFIYRYNWMFV